MLTRPSAGGLSRAYGGSAAECLRLAQSQPLVRYSRMEARCPFAHVDTLHRLCAAHGAEIKEQEWQQEQLITQLDVPDHSVSQLRKGLKEASNGQIIAAALDMHSLLA